MEKSLKITFIISFLIFINKMHTMENGNNENRLSELPNIQSLSTNQNTIVPSNSRNDSTSQANTQAEISLNINPFVQSMLNQTSVCEYINTTNLQPESANNSQISTDNQELQKIITEDLLCLLCYKRSGSWGHFKNHMKRKHPEINLYKCRDCNFSANDQETLAKHIIEVEKKSKKESYPCMFCDITSGSERNFYEHIKAKHIVPFKHKIYSQISANQNTIVESNSAGQANIQTEIPLTISPFLQSELNQISVCENVNTTNLQSEPANNSQISTDNQELQRTATEELLCLLCNKRSGSWGHFKNHMKRKHPEINLYKCRDCNFSANDQETLAKHLIEVEKKSKKESYPCMFCHITKGSERSFYEHIKTKHIVPFKCKAPFCGYKTTELSQLINHDKAMHKNQGNLKCSTCNSFSTFNSFVLEDHLDTCQGIEKSTTNDEQNATSQTTLSTNLQEIAQFLPFKCRAPFCGYKTTELSQLINHDKAMHKNQGNLKCGNCNSFSTFNSFVLEDHLDTCQSIEKSRTNDEQNTTSQTTLSTNLQEIAQLLNRCTFCEKPFSNNDQTNKHINKEHKLHRCIQNNCNYETDIFSEYEEHSQNTHNLQLTLTENLSCNLCKVKFNSWGSCTKHLKEVHPEINLFKCRNCHHSTNDQEELANHISKKHPGTQKYPCLFCKNKHPINKKASFSTHIKGKHLAYVKCEASNCKYICKSFSELEQHEQRKHKGKKPFTCKHCEFSSISSKLWKHHSEKCSMICQETTATIELAESSESVSSPNLQKNLNSSEKSKSTYIQTPILIQEIQENRANSQIEFNITSEISNNENSIFVENDSQKSGKNQDTGSISTVTSAESVNYDLSVEAASIIGEAYKNNRIVSTRELDENLESNNLLINKTSDAQTKVVLFKSLNKSSENVFKCNYPKCQFACSREWALKRHKAQSHIKKRKKNRFNEPQAISKKQKLETNQEIKLFELVASLITHINQPNNNKIIKLILNLIKIKIEQNNLALNLNSSIVKETDSETLLRSLLLLMVKKLVSNMQMTNQDDDEIQIGKMAKEIEDLINLPK